MKCCACNTDHFFLFNRDHCLSFHSTKIISFHSSSPRKILVLRTRQRPISYHNMWSNESSCGRVGRKKILPYISKVPVFQYVSARKMRNDHEWEQKFVSEVDMMPIQYAENSFLHGPPMIYSGLLSVSFLLLFINRHWAENPNASTSFENQRLLG